MFQEKHAEQKRKEVNAQQRSFQQPKNTDKIIKTSQKTYIEVIEIIDEGTPNNQIPTTNYKLKKILVTFWYPKSGLTLENFEELTKAIKSNDPKMNLWGLKGLNLFIEFKSNFKAIVQKIEYNLMQSIFSFAKQSQSENSKQLKKLALQVLKRTLKNKRLSNYSFQLGALSMCLEMIKEKVVETDPSYIQILNALANKTKESRAEFYSKGGLDFLVDLYLASRSQLQRNICAEFFKSIRQIPCTTLFPLFLKTKKYLSSLCRLLRVLQRDGAQLEVFLVSMFDYYSQKYYETRQIFAQQHVMVCFIQRIKKILQNYQFKMGVQYAIITQLQFIQRLIYKSPAQINTVLESKLFDYFQLLITRNPCMCFNDLRALIATMFTGNRGQISRMLARTKSIKFIRHIRKNKIIHFSKYVFQMVRQILKKAKSGEVLAFLQKQKIMDFLENNLHYHSIQNNHVSYLKQNLRLILQILQFAQNKDIFQQVKFIQDFKLSVRRCTKTTLFNHNSALVRSLARKMMNTL